MLRNLEDITKKIVEEYSPEGIILFGSAAGEGVGIGSDIDLLVIKDSPKRPMERRMEVETLLADREVALDILVYTPEEVRRLFSMGSPFMEEIFETGRMIYMRKATESWVKEARDDMESGAVLLDHGKYRAACYHSQQCVEKLLKALIMEKGEKPERTHDIIGLLNRAGRMGWKTPLAMDDAVFLNSIYKGRYPSEEGLLPYGEPVVEDAKRAVTAADEFFHAAEKLLRGVE